METLLDQDDVTEVEDFGPDPILLRKKGLPNPNPRDISQYKERISDPTYMEHAIDRIAMELMHFLAR